MRRLVYITALLLWPLTVAAQNFSFPSVTADEGVLLTCLGSDKAPLACLGAMTLDCRAENDIGNENLEERLCTVEELNSWRDLALRQQDRLARRLAAIPPAKHPPLLGDPAPLAKTELALWQAWVQGQCRLERAAASTSDRRAIVQDICLRDLTAQRYGRLRQLNARLKTQ
jgi:hypothetical protein